MQYIISFLEGLITFISPCLLPMLPIYISYFGGGNKNELNKANPFLNSLGFVGGFTTVFMTLGLFAGSIGSFLQQHQLIVNLVTGAIVVLFGLSYLGVIKLSFLSFNKGTNAKSVHNIAQAYLFGIVFSVSWTPCIGTFLGSALMLASMKGTAFSGVIMLLCYSLGLGIPFVLSAILIDKLKTTFDFIKKHYKAINIVCGTMLIIIGVLMMTGLMGRFLAVLTF